jgi:phospholipid/cholesterol/gamma-HCH transport system ATP-binding protein
MNENQIQNRVGELLDQVSLEAHRHKMPSEVSGGMRKRVGLARALALDPSILLVDEPSSGLDPVTSLEIDELLLGLKLRRGTTIVVVTHNIPSARRIGDTLAFLHEGRILESGTPQQLENSRQELVQQFMSVQGGT